MEDLNSIHALAYFNLLKTGSWVEDKIKIALKPLHLTHAQLNALFILHQNGPEPVSANTLKEKILVSNPDVTRLIDRLVKKGYVRRETCPGNRRKVDMYLTDSGRELFLTAHQAAQSVVGDYFKEQITEDEARELRRILHKIRA